MSDSVEEWRVISGYPDYEVSSAGRLRSYRGIGCGSHKRMAEPRLLSPAADAHGYRYTTLTSAVCGRRSAKIHRLVLEAFVGPPPKGMECRHLDGNQQNNALSNLQWGTSTENAADRRQHGTLSRGSKHGASKLTEAAVLEIRASTEPGVVLADRYGVVDSCISSVRKGLKWRHVPMLEKAI